MVQQVISVNREKKKSRKLEKVDPETKAGVSRVESPKIVDERKERFGGSRCGLPPPCQFSAKPSIQRRPNIIVLVLRAPG